MKKCLNCEENVKDTDTYCRNCGYPLQSNKNYVIINVINVFLTIAIVFMVILFIASYLVSN